ncbi:Aspartyl protease [Oceanobacillus limi]|uniref:Aspartyl protease n=1 Tax=Oceanobacillus limi TaxID=930131 RepID=A0A1I0CSY7_9BACI|nr:retropepsin-like aspartic protease [Oceanobacillus limi]SET22391.1 Aspartyl protease [Oceanobacillus limi]
MKIRVEKGLPIAELRIDYGKKSMIFNNVLIDTGCAVTIFDTDMMAKIGLIIDFSHGRPRRMYGVGGKGEVCIEQKVNGLSIDHQRLDDFNLQLGMVQEMYGFDGLVGLDFMLKTGMNIDFKSLKVNYKNN